MVDMGWSGDIHHVLHALRTVCAERDDEGKFLIIRDAPPFFLGCGPDCVVSDECMYLLNGREISLASLMNSTSYGLRNVTVI